MSAPPVPQIGVAGDMLVSSGGERTALGITGPTVIKASAGRVCRVSTIVAGTSAGTINDLATTSGASTLNQVATIPELVGTVVVDMPCAVGILIVPGSGQTAAVSYI